MRIFKAIPGLMLVFSALAASSKDMSPKDIQKKLVNVAALIQNHEDQLSSIEYNLSQAREEESAILEELGHSNQQLVETIHYLRHTTHYSPLLAMLSAAKPDDVIHCSLLVRSLMPEIHARNQRLLEKVKALSHIRAQLEAKQGQLRDMTYRYHQERDKLDALLQNRPDAPLTTTQDFDNQEEEEFILRPPVAGKLIPTYKNANPKWEPFTQGVLFSTRKGAHVVAPLSGKVSFAGELAQDQGKVVIMEAPHSHVVISGLGSLNCTVGQSLMAGEPIGRMPVGQKTPQLYLEVWRQEQTVDPQTVLIERKKGL